MTADEIISKAFVPSDFVEISNTTDVVDVKCTEFWPERSSPVTVWPSHVVFFARDNAKKTVSHTFENLPHTYCISIQKLTEKNVLKGDRKVQLCEHKICRKSLQPSRSSPSVDVDEKIRWSFVSKIFFKREKNSHESAEICKESKRFAEISHTLTNAEWSYTVDKRDVLGDTCTNDPEGAQFFYRCDTETND